MRWRSSLLVPVMTLAVCVEGLAQTGPYNLGSTPSPEEIRALDVLVGPSGRELRPGSGTAKEGAKVYAQRCAPCHGPNGEGIMKAKDFLFRGPALFGVKTQAGRYPFATTLWTYVNRSMPMTKPGSLSADEVYAVTAFVLYRNEIIQESDVLDAKSLPKVQMPNRNGFVPKEICPQVIGTVGCG